MTTIVKCVCVSKKESKNWDQNFPVKTDIELEVPYDQTSVYHKMSGGTNMVLTTVNQVAADMFLIGQSYMLEIRPAEPGE